MMKRTALTLALAAALALPNLGFGHAKLVTSSPAGGAELRDSPHVLTFSFDEAVKLAKLDLTRDGKPITVHLDTSAPGSKTVTVPVTGLTAGAYELHWTALSTDDGHVTKGTFTFTVLGATAPP
jgi:methionine-rich copper-binding protein CopC